MRAKKNLTFATLACSIVAIVAALLIGNNSNRIGYDIAMAAFGSALLGFIMSLIEYHTERRSAMENFWLEAIHALRKLKCIRPYTPRAPFEMLVGCFSEEEYNKTIQVLNIPEMLEHSAKTALIDWYKSKDKNSVSSSLPDEVWDRTYADRLEDEKKNIEKLINSCFNIASLDLSELDNAYGNLDFAVHNKKIRDELAYNQILNAIRKYRDQALIDFGSFRMGEGNENFVLEARNAYEYADTVFDVKEKSDDAGCWKQWFQTGFYKIDVALNQFWEEMYPGKKAEPIEKKPVCVVYFSKKDNRKVDEVGEENNAKS